MPFQKRSAKDFYIIVYFLAKTKFGEDIISKELNIKDPFFIFASAPSEGSQIRIFFDKLLQDLKINRTRYFFDL